jgi:hypothetical protein
MVIRKVWWIWSVVLVFTAQPSSAAWTRIRVLCGPVTAAVVKGDTITVYMSFYDTPDAHGGPGYKLLQTEVTNAEGGSGGQNTRLYSTQEHGLDQIYEYIAAKNGTASAQGVLYKWENSSEQPDENNSCTISIGRNVSPAKVRMKEWLWASAQFFVLAATGFELTAMSCLYAGPNAPAWCAYNWGGLAVVASAAAITTGIAEHADPPDSNYTTIPVIDSTSVFPTIAQGTMTWAAFNAMNDMASNQALVAQITRAIITAENRAATAAANGDTYWATQQQNARDGFLRLLSYTTNRQLATQQALANVMANEGLSFSWTAQEVLQMQLDEWFCCRLLDSTQQGLTAAGFSQADLDWMWMMVYSENPFTVAGTYPDRLLQENARLQQRANDMVSMLPEPNGHIALIACGMLIAFLSKRARM